MIKRSVNINGHPTSYSLEPEFHTELEVIARAKGISLARLVTEADTNRDPDTNLSSALRLLVLRTIKAGGKADRT